MEKIIHSKLISKCGTDLPNNAEGSLGLLALGDVGLSIWRNAIAAKQNNTNQTIADQKTEVT